MSLQGVTTEMLRGTACASSFAVERGTIEQKRWGLCFHPADLMKIRNNGRTPLYTRHTLGSREAERDRRKARG